MVDSSNWQAWGIPLIVIGALLLIALGLTLLRWYIRKPTEYLGTRRIDGKTVVITGGNTGIGKETAKELLKRGGKIIILCRDTERGRVAAEEISEEGGAPIELYQLDLANLESVRDCARVLKKNEPKIDILINNAGVMVTPKMATRDGFEMQLGTNHLGHFLLTLLLSKNIKAAAPSRIVNVSSLAHASGRMHWDDLHMKDNYDPFAAYSQSKLANILFTKSLAEKLKGSGVTTYVLHPGVIKTELNRHLPETYGKTIASVINSAMSVMAKTPKMGALTSIFCAVDDSIAEDSGKYYSGCKERGLSWRARNMEDAEKLWKISLKMVELEEDFSL